MPKLRAKRGPKAKEVETKSNRKRKFNKILLIFVNQSLKNLENFKIVDT